MVLVLESFHVTLSKNDDDKNCRKSHDLKVSTMTGSNQLVKVTATAGALKAFSPSSGGANFPFFGNYADHDL